jgi:hypothetical protein
MYKRGYGKVDKQRIALTDNSIIEEVIYKLVTVCLFVNLCILSSFVVNIDYLSMHAMLNNKIYSKSAGDFHEYF